MERAERRAQSSELWLQRAERVRDAFGLVLALVLLTYLLASLLDNNGWSAVVLTVSTSATSVVALVSSHVRARAVRVSIWLSVLTVGLAVIAAVSDERWFLNFASLVQICLLTVAMGAVLWRVVSSAEVGSRTILGAISVYATLGLLFTWAYGLIDRIEGGGFFEGVEAGAGDFIFFSYTTLTTTGYGNLVPASQVGRMVAGIEMMLGQIFLVTLVAGLVSFWRPGEGLMRLRQRKQRDVPGETGPAEPAS